MVLFALNLLCKRTSNMPKTVWLSRMLQPESYKAVPGKLTSNKEIKASLA